jgi:hypothetical protein
VAGELAGVRCWLCGVEPEGIVETTGLGDAKRSFVPGHWPPGDHEHAERPPTPAQLEQAGHEALMRIRQGW